MALQPYFLRTNRKAIFKNPEVISGILVGLFSSYFIYQFFFFFRETMRAFTNSLGGRVFLQLTDEEYLFYNLFLASIACVLGFYIFIKIAIEGSINNRDKNLRRKQRHILNEQGFFFWSFLSTYGRFSAVFGGLLITMPLQFDLDFYDDFFYLFFLIPIVLFFNVWPIILKSVGKKAYSWMLYSFVSIMVMSVFYANLNLGNDRAMDKAVLDNRIDSHYKIELPRSKFFSYHYRGMFDNFLLVNDTIEGREPIVFINNDLKNKCSINELGNHISSFFQQIDEAERDRFIPRLLVDKDVELKYVTAAKEEFRKLNINKTMLPTAAAYSKYPSTHPVFLNRGFIGYMPPRSEEIDSFLNYAETVGFSNHKLIISESGMRNYLTRTVNHIVVRVSKEKVFVGKKEVDKQELSEFMQKVIEKHTPDYMIVFEPDEDISYGRYIEFKDLYYSKIDLLRKTEAIRLYGTTFENLRYRNSNAFDKVSEKYPFALIEWTPEEKRLRALERKAGNIK
ncbi:hypothetical protein R9C00_25835 [Flammeovirgaceae bacterium SG7u.111]|nr:hypothetical protein [Flammeovirgaceae bacterium SG7u.132]WPO35119.1 hypothetical protein R9C00_25835 [Flammeovirgaceae bacterium SG7u.111]